MGARTPPTCLPRKALPLPTGAAGDSPNALVQNKHEKLKGNFINATSHLYAGVDNGALATILERNLKLLFETYGEYLTDDQRAYTMSLYAADGNLPMSGNAICGHDFSPPASTNCDVAPATMATLDRTLDMCMRLQSAHVHGVKDQDNVVKKCIDAAENVGLVRQSFVAQGGVDNGSRPTLGSIMPPSPLWAIRPVNPPADPPPELP